MPLFFLPSFIEGANVVEFLTAATILPVKDVAAAVTRYIRLGFKGRIYDGALPDGRPIYAFLKRDRIDLHLALVSSLEPKANTSAVYLYVDDPDSLYREWSAVAHEGRLDEPEDREWGMREMTYSDPDGNLLRIGRFLTRSDTPNPDHSGNKEHEGATEDEMQPTTPPGTEIGVRAVTEVAQVPAGEPNVSVYDSHDFNSRQSSHVRKDTRVRR